MARSLNEILLDCTGADNGDAIDIPDFMLSALPDGDRDVVMEHCRPVGTFDRGETAYYRLDDETTEDFRRYMAD